MATVPSPCAVLVWSWYHADPMLVFVGLAVAAPLSACSRPFGTDELTQALDAAESAFQELDPTTFAEEETAVQERLACLRDPATPALVERIHRVGALAAFLKKDDRALVSALGGVLDADPEAVLPSDLVPDRHPIRLAFEAELEKAPESPSRALLHPESGWFEVDGRSGALVSATRDAVIQRFDGQGQLQETRFHAGGTPLGDWEGSAEDLRKATAIRSTAPHSSTVVKKTDHPQRVAFGIGTGAALVATGALYLVASTSKTQALDLTVPEDDASAARGRANATTIGWIGTSVLTAGLGAAMVITW